MPNPICPCCQIDTSSTLDEPSHTDRRCEECLEFDRKPGFQYEPFKELILRFEWPE